MARYEISADAAFALLRRWSSHTNIKLRDISKMVVDATISPSDGTEPASRPDGHRVDLEELICRLGTAGTQMAGPCHQAPVLTAEVPAAASTMHA
jgi:hypothetical protein